MLSHFLRAATPKAPATATLLQPSSLQATATSSATKTFSGMSFGSASSTRWIIALVQLAPSSTARTVSSATIGGVSATITYNTASAGTTFGLTAVYANVPTGTSGSVVVNLTGTTSTLVSRCILYTVTGRDTLSYLTNTDTGTASATSRSTTLDVPAYGFNLNMFVSGSPITSPTWSGTPSTPVLVVDAGLLRSSAFSDNINTNSTSSVTATISWTSGATTSRMITSSWEYS